MTNLKKIAIRLTWELRRNDPTLNPKGNQEPFSKEGKNIIFDTNKSESKIAFKQEIQNPFSGENIHEIKR